MLILYFLNYSYWEPNSAGDYASYAMAYYWGNFLPLQDIIERSLSVLLLDGVDVATEYNDFHGVYMQEFPYPCYTYDE